ncbi:MAG: ABC transporter substrate-binding protein [Thermodesulfobacteriota bacterium]|nr:ABC transporter substrate-binding protein [Thermodesulfobacteriota bacterium]
MKRDRIFLLAMSAIILLFPMGSQAASGKKIKIGVIAPMKFNAGMQQWSGARLAAEEINAAGGVKIKGIGHKIDLVKKDSNEMRSITDAVNAMESLITSNKVNFVTGGYKTEVVMSLLEIIADYKTIFITATGTPIIAGMVAKNYDRYKYWFRGIHLNAVYFTTVKLAVLEAVVAKLRSELGIAKPKVAIVVDKIKIGDSIVKFAKAMIPKMGAEIAGVWRPSLFSTDHTAELAAIKAAGAHAIFMFFPGPSGTVFAKQWGELKFPAAAVGYIIDGFSKGFWKATGGKCDYLTFWNAYGRVEITDKSIPHWDNTLNKTGDIPSLHTGTYDVIYILKNAVERAGTLESDAVVAALEKTDFHGPKGRIAFHQMGYKWPHDAIWGIGYQTYVGLQWQKGKLMTVWPTGQAVLGNKKWEGLRYKGTVDYQLPPWVIKYWEGKKGN